MASIPQVDPQIDQMTSAQLSARIETGRVCGTAEADRWFPADPNSVFERQAYEIDAREACADCPVHAECLALALRVESQPYARSHGIWGGLAPWDRRRIIRSRRRRAANALRKAEGVSA